MENFDKKWIKWIILSVLFGFILGLLVNYLVGMVATGLFLSLVNIFAVPGFIILFLLFTLYEYNKEKEDTIG